MADASIGGPQTTSGREAGLVVYPIYLTNLHARLAVVVGGGTVGERKILGLLQAQANVRLISPLATDALTELAENERIEWLPRAYRSGDLDGAFLAFAATDQRAVNRAVAEDAATAGLLCNVADARGEGDFHVPALLRENDLVITVGSGGSSPGRARSMRDRIAQWLSRQQFA